MSASPWQLIDSQIFLQHVHCTNIFAKIYFSRESKTNLRNKLRPTEKISTSGKKSTRRLDLNSRATVKSFFSTSTALNSLLEMLFFMRKQNPPTEKISTYGKKSTRGLDLNSRATTQSFSSKSTALNSLLEN